MKKALFILLMLPFVAMQCQKEEGPECHHSIKIQNNSSETIIVALKGGDQEAIPVAGYRLEVGANQVQELNNMSNSSCWEDEISPTSVGEIYLLKAGAIRSDTLVRVDTLVKYNQVLKRIPFNTNEVKNNNFVITYP